MFGKCLSVVNDSDNILEELESDNWSYAHDNRYNHTIALKIKDVIVNNFSENFSQFWITEGNIIKKYQTIRETNLFVNIFDKNACQSK